MDSVSLSKQRGPRQQRPWSIGGSVPLGGKNLERAVRDPFLLQPLTWRLALDKQITRSELTLGLTYTKVAAIA